MKPRWNTNPIQRFDRLASSWRVRLKDRRHHPWAAPFWPSALEADTLSREQLCTLQQQRLQDLVEHAVEHVPYYRKWADESGYRVGDPVRLESLPIVTKADYMRDIEQFQSDAYAIEDLQKVRTSGSSGEPFRFRKHPQTTDIAFCCMWRAMHRHGLRPGDRRVYLWGRSYRFKSTLLGRTKFKIKHALRDWLNVTLGISAYDLTHENVEEIIQNIERFNPVYMHGYVSAQYTIARALLDSGRRLRAPQLRAVITESEKLYDFQRQAMEQAFGCPVLEHYGSVEFSNIAQPDPDGNMRINEDIFVVERADNGEAIITGLFSHAFPFIRYKLGDLIDFEEDIKPGLPYKSFKSIIGRTVDMIPVAAGGSVHGVALAHLIDPHLDHVLKYQIHQTAIDHFVIRLVVKTTLPESVATTIRKDMRGMVGSETTIEINEVDHIEPASSGKFRWVISDVNQKPSATPGTS